jgi:hypothetical protein
VAISSSSLDEPEESKPGGPSASCGPVCGVSTRQRGWGLSVDAYSDAWSLFSAARGVLVVPQRRRACAIQRAYRWEGVVHRLINAAQTACDAVCVCVYALASELCCARVGVHNKAEQEPQGLARCATQDTGSELGSLPARCQQTPRLLLSRGDA